jgi:Fic family protein
MVFSEFQILNIDLLEDFNEHIDFNALEALEKAQEFDMPVDYFKFYKSISSVYSSKIEGEKIDFDSFFKHKFLNVAYKNDYTQKADDLYETYEFIEERAITLEHLKQAHSMITRNLLPKSQQGFIRTNPMFVINDEDRIEYVAAEPNILESELEKLFHDISILTHRKLNINEVFYFASLIHLVFVKIHPFQDGNGRTARLLEKWFLLNKLGEKAMGIQLEKNYFKHLADYYKNIKVLGLEYQNLNFKNALNFLLMSIKGLNEQNQ